MAIRSESIIHEVMASEVYRKAVATLTAEHDRTVEDIIALTQVAAPSFQEATRAGAFLAMAEAHGLRHLEIDAEGNVTGLRPGAGNGPLICIAAHLDTVFPAGTDLTVRREGTRLFAPGVGDDTRSLAVPAGVAARDGCRRRTHTRRPAVRCRCGRGGAGRSARHAASVSAGAVPRIASARSSR